jgi:hypothetical protein
MGTIMIRCPETDQLVSVGIDTDKDSFASLPEVEASPVQCPACGQQHAWSKSDAILETTGRPPRTK